MFLEVEEFGDPDQWFPIAESMDLYIRKVCGQITCTLTWQTHYAMVYTIDSQ